MTNSASTEDVMNFSSALSQYLDEKHAPDLWHRRPGENPSTDKGGPTIRYQGSSFNKMLWWKVKAPQKMTLQLGNSYRDLARKLELPSGIELERAEDHGWKTHDYLVIPVVPPVDLSKPFDEQIEIVENALGKARKLVEIVGLLEEKLGEKN